MSWEILPKDIRISIIDLIPESINVYYRLVCKEWSMVIPIRGIMTQSYYKELKNMGQLNEYFGIYGTLGAFNIMARHVFFGIETISKNVRAERIEMLGNPNNDDRHELYAKYSQLIEIEYPNYYNRKKYKLSFYEFIIVNFFSTVNINPNDDIYEQITNFSKYQDAYIVFDGLKCVEDVLEWLDPHFENDLIVAGLCLLEYDSYIMSIVKKSLKIADIFLEKALRVNNYELHLMITQLINIYGSSSIDNNNNWFPC